MTNTLTNATSINSTTFLLLNTEFRNQTYLSGFEFYGQIAGLITINVYFLK